MKDKIINIYKPIGATPLEVINAFKNKYPDYSASKIAYAGRLDPMAHGVMILLVDEECKNRDVFQDLKKSYEFKLIPGVSTDTYDALGIVNDVKTIDYPKDFESNLKNIVSNFPQSFIQAYPPYSSKPVNSKPLFWWAKNGKLDQIELPTKQCSIDNFKLLDIIDIGAEELIANIHKKISSVKGDFRQEAILEQWDKLKTQNNNHTFKTFDLSLDVSTGTYIRSIANTIGEQLQTGAIAYDIYRTAVGNYTIDDSIRL